MSDQRQPSQTLDENLQSVNDNMVEGLGKLAEYFGYNKVLGQLYGVLFLSPNPMSLDDLAGGLEISKASVSMNMRTLEQLGIVREVWVRGDRRKYYEAETDFWKIVVNILRSRELRELEQALNVLEQSSDQLREVSDDLDASERALAEFYTDRVDMLRDFFRFAQLLLNSFLRQAGNFDVTEVTKVNLE